MEQRRQAMLQLHLSDQQFYCVLRCDLYQRFDGSPGNALEMHHWSWRLLELICIWPSWSHLIVVWYLVHHDFMESFNQMSWWCHQMETFSALLAICAGNSPVPGEFPNKGQWRGALMFTLIYTRINNWVNNGEAGDLRCYRAHYDVIVMLHRYVIPQKCILHGWWF